MASIFGTNFADYISPWYVSDGVVGGMPSSANDSISGSKGNDYINGGGGRDYLYGGDGRDTIVGGAQTDYIYGNNDNDYLFGYGGNDWIDGGSGADRMYGGSGNDTYTVDNTGDRIFEYAGGGIDTVRVTGSYSLESQPHLENLTLFNSVAFGTGNNANNVIDAYNSRSIGSGVRVTLRGLGGNDTIYGSNNFATSDEIFGGDQSDRLYGYSGNDRLYGENHMDYLDGGSGNDWLVGGAGTDTLRGGWGDDVLIGNSNRAVSQGAEFDALWGESGRDRFVLGNGFGAFYKDAGFAVLKDFSRHLDTIQLANGAGNYRLREGQFNGSGGLDTEILHNGDRIALIENNVGLNLNSGYFDYV